MSFCGIKTRTLTIITSATSNIFSLSGSSSSIILFSISERSTMFALPFAVCSCYHGLCARFIHISSFDVHTIYHLTITSLDEDLGIQHFHDEARATAPNKHTHTHTHTHKASYIVTNSKGIERELKIIIIIKQKKKKK